jgi:hypothetical protein
MVARNVDFRVATRIDGLSHQNWSKYDKFGTNFFNPLTHP